MELALQPSQQNGCLEPEIKEQVGCLPFGNLTYIIYVKSQWKITIYNDTDGHYYDNL